MYVYRSGCWRNQEGGGEGVRGTEMAGGWRGERDGLRGERDVAGRERGIGMKGSEGARGMILKGS